MFECQSKMEKLSPFVDIAALETESMRRIKRPKRFSETETASFSSHAAFGFPQLTEEPSQDLDQSVVCRICVRLPDGRKIQRRFFKSESVQLLWSFCDSVIDESVKKRFKLFQAFPGEYKTLYYGSNTTFEQSGLSNSLVSVTWL